MIVCLFSDCREPAERIFCRKHESMIRPPTLRAIKKKYRPQRRRYSNRLRDLILKAAAEIAEALKRESE